MSSYASLLRFVTHFGDLVFLLHVNNLEGYALIHETTAYDYMAVKLKDLRDQQKPFALFRHVMDFYIISIQWPTHEDSFFFSL